MSPEQKYEQNPGRSWIKSIVLDTIDRVLRSNLTENFTKGKKSCVNLIDIIVAPLVEEKIPEKIVQNLKIEFVRPEKGNGVLVEINPDLKEIDRILREEFGDKVMQRIRLKLNEETEPKK